MYRRRIDQKYIDKIHADYLSKQPRIFRRHLAINYRFTNFDVVKIKWKDNLLSFVAGYDELPEEMSFFCIGHNKISTQKFRSVTDIVFTDITHHVIGLYPNTYPDCLVQCKSKSIANAWILPQHAIEYLKIKTQDKIYTQSRFI